MYSKFLIFSYWKIIISFSSVFLFSFFLIVWFNNLIDDIIVTFSLALVIAVYNRFLFNILECNIILGNSRGIKYTCDSEGVAVPKFVDDAVLKSVNKSIEHKCNLALKEENEIIKGIDIFGEECISYENYNYLNELNNCKINVSIHTGEYKGINKSNNLEDILKINNKNRKIRIGHGIQLESYSELKNKYKEEDIHIELCPLSNYILNYTPKLQDHPGKKMYNEGLRVSINSDDPSIYNYDYVSYDWFFVLALWSLNITDIENIIIFSIEDSFFTEDIKKEIKENFYRSISAWKIKYNKTLEASIEAAKEYLNTLF